ncbi:MAG: hypothetical protein HYU04_01860 [Candidatus Wildermuthbacteria bacterium]|nr:hypothetical protein [Candidatus Wildermuthbacteria bacterium]
MTILEFQKHILSWYKAHRRNLPWRNTKNPYHILVSEVMLQQTQVTRVIPKYEEFLAVFPTLEKLANAPDKKLLKVWQGLGYWRRAKYLKEIAQILLQKVKATNSQNADSSKLEKARAIHFQSSSRKRFCMVPSSNEGKSLSGQTAKLAGVWTNRYSKISLPERLEALPGIGHYTARALACFAFNSTEAFLDTNIRRVYLHFFFPSTRSARSGQAPKKISDAEILPIAQKAIDTLPSNVAPREWHYALFDYGATVLKDKKINKRSKHYIKQSKFEGSFRSFRTKVMRFFLDKQNQTATTSRIKRFLKEAQSPYDTEKILTSLKKDGLIKKKRNSYSL